MLIYSRCGDVAPVSFILFNFARKAHLVDSRSEVRIAERIAWHSAEPLKVLRRRASPTERPFCEVIQCLTEPRNDNTLAIFPSVDVAFVLAGTCPAIRNRSRR